MCISTHSILSGNNGLSHLRSQLELSGRAGGNYSQRPQGSVPLGRDEEMDKPVNYDKIKEVTPEQHENTALV